LSLLLVAGFWQANKLKSNTNGIRFFIGGSFLSVSKAALFKTFPVPF